MGVEADITFVHRSEGRVVVNGRATLDGQPIPVNWPVVIVNPPEQVPDGLGGFRHDPDEAIRQVVLDVAKQTADG